MLKARSLVFLLCMLLAVAFVPARAADEYTVGLSSSKELGKFLVGAKGMTLYSFTPDPLNQSVCNDKCAENWPPLVVDSADKVTADPAIPGTFGTTTRKDGSLQVTYNGIALYYWVRDKAAGDTTGHRVGRVWWVVPPATAYAQRLPKVGSVLVGPKGMTLYLFTKDTPDVSTCYDKCAVNWPPLLVKSADEFVPGVNLPGKFSTTERKDKTLQVTYNGWPLYYWKDDKVIGDATGEGVGKVWYTLPQETVASSNTKDLGDFLISADGMTLYTFAKDTAGVSNCSGDCAKNWPPFTVNAEDRLTALTGLKGKLDTLKLENGSLQVTYNGMPLYLFKDDHKPGDTAGQGAGGVWAVAKA
jgi:predicted lipoprotein with Yx(FWY)xxD motif